jgi:hypothetical protein
MHEMEKPEPMPQGPTNNIFLFVGGFGLIASIVGIGLIVAASVGFSR